MICQQGQVNKDNSAPLNFNTLPPTGQVPPSSTQGHASAWVISNGLHTGQVPSSSTQRLARAGIISNGLHTGQVPSSSTQGLARAFNNQQGRESARAWISKGVNQQGRESARAWIRRDPFRKRFFTSKTIFVLKLKNSWSCYKNFKPIVDFESFIHVRAITKLTCANI